MFRERQQWQVQGKVNGWLARVKVSALRGWHHSLVLGKRFCAEILASFQVFLGL